MFLSQYFVDSTKKKSPETIQNQNRSAAIFFATVPFFFLTFCRHHLLSGMNCADKEVTDTPLAYMFIILSA